MMAQRLTDIRATKEERPAAAEQLAQGGDLSQLRALAEAADIDPAASATSTLASRRPALVLAIRSPERVLGPPPNPAEHRPSGKLVE